MSIEFADWPKCDICVEPMVNEYAGRKRHKGLCTMIWNTYYNRIYGRMKREAKRAAKKKAIERGVDVDEVPIELDLERVYERAIFDAQARWLQISLEEGEHDGALPRNDRTGKAE